MRPVVRTQLDYYAVLEVTPASDTAEVNAAFRRLAWRYHPDRNPAPGATLQFQDINEAHQVLSDPARRADYDAKWYPKSGEAPSASQHVHVSRPRRHWRRHHRNFRTAVFSVITLMIVSSAWSAIYTGMRIAHSGSSSFAVEARAVSIPETGSGCNYSMEIVPVLSMDGQGRRTVEWETNVQNCYGGNTRIPSGRQYAATLPGRPPDATFTH